MPKTKLILISGVILLLAIAGIKIANFNKPNSAPKANLAQAAQTFIPDPDSPLGRGEHPRLHITQATLPDFQARIANDYFQEYQAFVNWIDSSFSVYEDLGAGLRADYHALIYVLGSIDNINYQHNISEYGDRAIEIMINQTQIDPSDEAVDGKAYSLYKENFAKMARAYDWMWNQLTVQEKTSIANWIADAGIVASGPSKGIDNNGQIRGLWSSTYLEAWYPWYYALAIYNDGIRDSDAQTLIDLFGEWMLNGKWLDAQNWVAREQGGTSEIGAYSLWHSLRHIMNIDGWRTATGENYFAQGTSIAEPDAMQYYPQFLLYRLGPHGKANPGRPGGYEWKVIKLGELSSRHLDVGMPTSEIRVREVLAPLGAPLKDVNPDMASLNRWLLENRTSDKMGYGHINFIQLLWGDRSVPAKSPQELGLPTSQFFEGLGTAMMRTGFDSIDDTAVVVMAPPYQLDGHSWLNYTGIPQGFTLDKYGPLVLRQQAFYRSESAESNRNNQMRFTDPLETADGGFKSENSSAALDVRDYTPGNRYDIGGMKKHTFETDYDYLHMDYTKYYVPERVSSYTRQFVYLKPETNTESDYIVIFDRTETTHPDIIKRWELSMAYDPQINGEENQVREGKWEYTNADQITISNNIGADPYSNVDYEGHGRLFVKSLLPEQKKIVKVGGPDHEFEMDDGTAHGYADEAADYAYLNSAGAYYTGTYYTDVVALQDNTQENFLHVLQTADANFVSTMAPAVRVDGDTMVGAHILDDIQGHKVAMFSRTEENQIQVAYSISSSQTVEHLIADLHPHESYEVRQDGDLIGSFGVNEAGTIHFNSVGGGSFQITGVGINIPPTVEISAEPTSGTASLTVQFTATAEDSDGTIDSYSWSFGDDGNSTEQNPSHTYSSQGTYTATLTVTDNEGAQASDSIIITVNPPPPDSTPPTIPQGLSCTGQYETSVSLTWQAASDPETGVDFYKIYRDETQIDTTEQTSYTDTGLTVNTTYSYQVSAVNGIGLESEKSDPLNVTTQTDTIPPTVVSVTTESTTQVKIVFSELIEQTSAEDINNYNIDQGITIFSASLDSNQTTVTLTTLALSEQATYTLTINNVTDQASQPNTIAPDTTFTFRGTNFIAHWNFDEGTGQTTQDSSPGQDNPGTIYGATWTTGKINAALEFDGSDDYVEMPSSERLKLTNNGTIVFWIKPRTFSNFASIIHQGTSRWISGTCYLLSYASGGYQERIRIYLADDENNVQEWCPNTNPHSADTWYHVAFTWDGNKINFYSNGVKEDDTSQTVIPKQLDGRLTIGAWYDAYYFNGLIDDVRIYDRAITPEEILELYEPSIATPELTLTKSANVSQAAPGETITYTITYQNIGTGDAQAVVITDPIPVGTIYVSGGDRFEENTVYWDIGVVEAGGGGSVEMQVRVE